MRPAQLAAINKAVTLHDSYREYWQRLGTCELYGLHHAQRMGAGVLQRLETGGFYGLPHVQGMGAGVQAEAGDR